MIGQQNKRAAPYRQWTWAVASLLLCFNTTVAADVATVVVSGLGGNVEYQQNFDRYAANIAENSRTVSGQGENTILLPGNAARKQNIIDTLNALAKSDISQLSLYLIGHGSYDGHQYKFNIPGPDITGSEIRHALAAFEQQRQLVVVATSASGALLETLKSDQRVLITATKNGRERNAVKFAEYLSEALASTSADVDKNEIINAAEMFNYAERAVQSHYEEQKLLAPEHPRLEGSFADKIDTARYGTLLRAGVEVSPQLLAKRNELSQQVANLRSRKTDYSEDDYFDALEALMLQLAAVQIDIDQPNDQPDSN